MAEVDFSGWSCPLPLRDHARIVMGHGGGGKLTDELIEHLFLPAFGDTGPTALGDSADIGLTLAAGERVVMSTDSYVVRPLFFPGGSIGELAINGTINDLAMSGARPVALTAGFVLSEGLPMATLHAVVEAMATAARTAGVRVVTGDTKVIEAGVTEAGTATGEPGGLIINTAGVGVVAAGVDIGPARVTVGDAVLVSGTVGDHAIAVMSAREGLDFSGDLASDSAALHGLVAALLDAGVDVHALRDPTRGGVAATLNEIANTANVGIEIDDDAIPVRAAVHGGCSFLGLDPLELANEGKLVAFVANDHADRALAIMRAHRLGGEAAIIGNVVGDHPGLVAARTPLGATRIVDTPLGEALPRIC